jgi:hypothetical protein
VKIIFLDIDGVLNGHVAFGNGYCGIRQENVAELNHLLQEVPDAKIVISSSWRYMMPDSMNLDGFCNLLLSHGIDGYDTRLVDKKGVRFNRIIGYTLHDEKLGGRNGRGKQILHWLVNNNFNPRFDRHVVLDDMMWDFEKHPQLDIILTDPGKGLQRQQVEIAITKLNRPIGY